MQGKHTSTENMTTALTGPDRTEVIPPLNKTERKILAEQEAIIEAGLNTVIGVGDALLTIRDKRLYREEFGTFEEYCRTKWRFSKSHANRYIAASSVTHTLEDIDPNVMPKSESQIRPLTALKPAEQKRVWKLVIEDIKSGASLTANLVTKKITECLPDAPTYKQAKERAGKDPRLLRSEVLTALEKAARKDEEKLVKMSWKEILRWFEAVIKAMR